MKKEQELRSVYKEWLIQKAESFLSVFGNYRELCEYLYSRRFYWKIDADANRAEDGVYLRILFSDESEIFSYSDISSYMNSSQVPCNLLEMMIALAIRCEKYIMQDPDCGDRSGLWLYGMINSLGLDKMIDGQFNPTEAERIVDLLLERRYSPNGKGSLFSNDVMNPTEDFTKLEIWCQLNWYLSSIPF